jgi:hypothetical protein
VAHGGRNRFAAEIDCRLGEMGSMNLLYTSSNIDIYHDEPNGWLYADWKGYQTERYVHMGCDCMLNWLVTCQQRGWHLERRLGMGR